jgi:hypothetical protein
LLRGVNSYSHSVCSNSKVKVPQEAKTKKFGFFGGKFIISGKKESRKSLNSLFRVHMVQRDHRSRSVGPILSGPCDHLQKKFLANNQNIFKKAP